MNQNLQIAVNKYTPDNAAMPPVFFVSLSEQTPSGVGGFSYPLVEEEVKILISKLQEAIKPKQ